MLPPWRSGGIVERGPVSGATPSSPQNGRERQVGRPARTRPRSPAGVQARDLQVAGPGTRRPAGRSRGSTPSSPSRRARTRAGRSGACRPARRPTTSTGPVTWSTLVEVEGVERLGRRGGRDLAVRGVQAVELDDVARADARHRRDGRVPGQVVLVAGDLDGCGGKSHRRTSVRRPEGGDYRTQVPASRSTTASESSPTAPTMIELIPSSLTQARELLDEAVDGADEDVRRVEQLLARSPSNPVRAGVEARRRPLRASASGCVGDD